MLVRLSPGIFMGIHNRYEILMRDELEAHKKSEVQWGACYYYSSTFPFAEVYSDCLGDC